MKRLTLVFVLGFVFSSTAEANGGGFLRAIFQPRQQRVNVIVAPVYAAPVKFAAPVKQFVAPVYTAPVKQFVAPVYAAPLYVQPVQAYVPLSVQYSYAAPVLAAPVYSGGSSFETQQLRQKTLELELQLLQMRQQLQAPMTVPK